MRGMVNEMNEIQADGERLQGCLACMRTAKALLVSPSHELDQQQPVMTDLVNLLDSSIDSLANTLHVAMLKEERDRLKAKDGMDA